MDGFSRGRDCRDCVADRVSQEVLKREINMPLITVVIYLIVVGVLLWLVNAYIPMDGKIKNILNIVVVVVVVLWLLSLFLPLGNLGAIRTPR